VLIAAAHFSISLTTLPLAHLINLSNGKTMPSLFSPYDLGTLALRNRIVMAPMTRSRAKDYSPTPQTALYYRQRAGAGLIISEGTPISEEARGQVFTAGLYRPEDIRGWKLVTDAVHEEGGRIFAQLWHVGRNSHVSLQKDGVAPVSSVAVTANAMTYGYDQDRQPALLSQSQPRALTTAEIPRVIADFTIAACNAMDAGFDGVELHGANGYLFEQFINGALNTRNDQYGGPSIANRLRFTLETLESVCAAVGSRRVGIRLAPFGRFNDMLAFGDEEETWLELAEQLSRRGLAYVHISDQATLGAQPIPAGFLSKFRNAYRGTLMVAGGYLKENGQAALDENRSDLIAIGRPYIANPDLVERLQNDWPLAEPDRNTFYTGDDEGYIDYPPYESGQLANGCSGV
jgi:2,4-dienoyl-CoA reductase-like NADH-dependent reductase (Old Yellow Enzyme family)